MSLVSLVHFLNIQNTVTITFSVSVCWLLCVCVPVELPLVEFSPHQELYFLASLHTWKSCLECRHCEFHLVEDWLFLHCHKYSSTSSWEEIKVLKTKIIKNIWFFPFLFLRFFLGRTGAIFNRELFFFLLLSVVPNAPWVWRFPIWHGGAGTGLFPGWVPGSVPVITEGFLPWPQVISSLYSLISVCEFSSLSFSLSLFHCVLWMALQLSSPAGESSGTWVPPGVL